MAPLRHRHRHRNIRTLRIDIHRLRIGNPKSLRGVSLTLGAAVNRRFRAGMRHFSQKGPLPQVIPALRAPRHLRHFRRVDAMQPHLDALTGTVERAGIAVVAVIDGTGFTRLDAGADDGGKDADDE